MPKYRLNEFSVAYFADAVMISPIFYLLLENQHFCLIFNIVVEDFLNYCC